MADEAERGARSNLAIHLHDILNALSEEARDGNKKQRDALCKVLRVPPNDGALLHSRLADLHRLPTYVRQALTRAGAPPKFFEWQHAVEVAVSQLSGSVHTNLGPFRETAGLSKALIQLDMCQTMLDDHDSLETKQLSEIRDAIETALTSVINAEDIDPDLAEWLESTLRKAESVVEEAEIFGAEAARDRLWPILGDIRRTPVPPATTAKEEAAVMTVVSIASRLVTLLDAGTKIAALLPKIAALLPKFAGE